jgi:hypothetical protein
VKVRDCLDVMPIPDKRRKRNFVPLGKRTKSVVRDDLVALHGRKRKPRSDE